MTRGGYEATEARRNGEGEGARLGVPGADEVATVVVPPTTPPAHEMLQRYWDSGAKPAATVLVEASPYPPLDQASPRS
jgi:hypothetical protein